MSNWNAEKIEEVRQIVIRRQVIRDESRFSMTGVVNSGHRATLLNNLYFVRRATESSKFHLSTIDTEDGPRTVTDKVSDAVSGVMDTVVGTVKETIATTSAWLGGRLRSLIPGCKQ